MAGHPPVPEFEKAQRVREESAQVVKKHVPDAAAENDAEQGSPDDEVLHRLGLEVGIPLPGQSAVHPDPHHERRNISQPVPPQSEARPKLDDKWTEMMDVVGEEHRPRE